MSATHAVATRNRKFSSPITKLAIVVLLSLPTAFWASTASAQSCSQYYQYYQYYMSIYNQYRTSNQQTYRNAAPQFYSYAQTYLKAYQQCSGGSTKNNSNSSSGNNSSSSNSNTAFRKQLESNATYYKNKAINDLMRYNAKNGYKLQYYLAPTYAGQNYMGPYYTNVSKWEATREITRRANNLGVVFVIGSY